MTRKRLILLVEITSPPSPFASLSIVNGLTQPALGEITSQTLLASGGFGTLTWQLLGNVPPGITISSTTGIVSGVWSTAGSYSFYARVSDEVGQVATRSFSWAVADSDVVPPDTSCANYTVQDYTEADVELTDLTVVLSREAADGHLCNLVLGG